MNPIMLIDGYKLDHRRQYPDGTEIVFSNFTPRSSRVNGVNKVVFFGLQYFLKRYLDADNGEFAGFFASNRAKVLARYKRRIDGYLGPNAIGLNHIEALHSLGYLPLRFCALPEGTLIPLRVPMLTVENTHPGFSWLTNYIETLMSCVLWLPCTSATTAFHMRQMLTGAASEVGADLGFVQWQGHDFSFRGMGCPEAAALSGAGHLLSFTGTDTLPAIDLIEEYYGAPDGYLIGGSVPATEHSVMCAGGADDELQTFARILDLYPSGVVSVVSDTWDFWKVITAILPQLKDRIMSRDGKLVIRPDSGNPADILCGDPTAAPGTPQALGLIECLWNLFGGTKTATGHRVLDRHIGAIYGDSITYDRACEITNRLICKRFAPTNCVFGIGSYTYQYVTRDTYGFAMKATWAQINGKGVDLYKTPKTDDGTKNSAKGRLAVLRGKNGLELVNCATPEQEAASELKLVWQDGRFIHEQSFDKIRALVERQMSDV